VPAGPPEAMHQVDGVVGVVPDAEPENDLTLLPVGELEGNLERGAGSNAAPTLPESRERVMAAGLRSVPLRPRNSVRSALTVRFLLSGTFEPIFPWSSRLRTLDRF